MATWGTPVTAIPLSAPDGTSGAASGTSTSTLLLRDTRGLYTLRMFNILSVADDGSFASSTYKKYFQDEDAESLDPSVACSGYSSIEYPNTWTNWLETESSFLPRGRAVGPGDLDFALAADGSRADTDVALLQRSCVPGFRVGTGWPYAHRVYAQTGACSYQTFNLEGDFWVLYKDPCVVRVPARSVTGGGGPGGDGGLGGSDAGAWLMVMVRVRMLAGEVADANDLLDPGKLHPENPQPEIGRAAGAGLTNSGRCFADIVAWAADDVDFRTNVRGPFLMVHSSYALDTAPHARLWLGVPGAAWVRTEGDRWLYVYYVAAPHGDDAALDPTTGIPLSALGEPLGACTGLATAPENYTGSPDEVDAPGQSLALAVRKGMAVKRFRLSDLYADVVDVASPIPEVDWTLYGSTGWSPVTGEALGYVTVWCADGGFEIPAGEVRTWEERVLAKSASGYVPIQADPMPVARSGLLTLYFAAIAEPPDPADPDPVVFVPGKSYSGHGLWRATAMPRGFMVDDGTSVPFAVASFGTHFVTSGRFDGREVMFEGQLVHSFTHVDTYIDPDPVVLPDLTIRVYCGRGGGPLEVLTGSAADAAFDDVSLV